MKRRITFHTWGWVDWTASWHGILSGLVAPSCLHYDFMECLYREGKGGRGGDRWRRSTEGAAARWRPGIWWRYLMGHVAEVEGLFFDGGIGWAFRLEALGKEP